MDCIILVPWPVPDVLIVQFPGPVSYTMLVRHVPVFVKFDFKRCMHGQQKATFDCTFPRAFQN